MPFFLQIKLLHSTFYFILLHFIGIEWSENMTLPAPGTFEMKFPPILDPITPLDYEIQPYFIQQPARANSNSGRLLTPAEGCGMSQIALRGLRIIGGRYSRNSAWPWMVMLGYKLPQGGATFKCGKMWYSFRIYQNLVELLDWKNYEFYNRWIFNHFQTCSICGTLHTTTFVSAHWIGHYTFLSILIFQHFQCIFAFAGGLLVSESTVRK